MPHADRPNHKGAPSDTRRPVRRSRSSVIGRRYQRTGTEPVTARSALGMRLWLSVCFMPLFVAAAVLFAVWATRSDTGSTPTPSQLAGLAALCAALAVFAAVDLAVVLRRRKTERPSRRTAP
ncbi:DUF6343 family protein [Streptomyces sp. NBC_00631]|uniref:DUF6343 family protein n=1 Tax=Streptomyces sp. NBC_00631 TaxID=2975793 RepID=UPI0030E45DB6